MVEQQPHSLPRDAARYRTSPPAAVPRQRLHPPRPWAARYAVPLAAWLLAFGLTLALRDYVERAAFVFFWIAVLFAAWYGGLVPALLSSLAAVLAVNYFMVPPLHELGIRSVSDLLLLGIFFAASMTVAALTTALALADRRAA